MLGVRGLGLTLVTGVYDISISHAGAEKTAHVAHGARTGVDGCGCFGMIALVFHNKASYGWTTETAFPVYP